MIAGLLLIALISVADAAPGVTPRDRYVPVGRPLVVTVAAPEEGSGLALVLMEHDGREVARLAPVAAGMIDLRAELGAAIDGARATYLQLLVDEVPVGSALVVQPLRSRMVPVTRVVRDEAGAERTRIVGWRDEAIEPEPSVAGAESEPAPEPETSADPAAPIAPGALLNGHRLWVERDVVLETDRGPIRFALRPDEAPNTAWNFLDLAAGGFYRDGRFHRIVPLTAEGEPFVIQGGDPGDSGAGGPGWWLPLEPSGLPHDFGVISMARDDDPDSAGSQFFVALSRAGTRHLDGAYCAFGEAVFGAETIRALAAVELADAETGRPAMPPRLIDALVVPAPPREPGRGRPDRPLSAQPPPTPAPERVPR